MKAKSLTVCETWISRASQANTYLWISVGCGTRSLAAPRFWLVLVSEYKDTTSLERNVRIQESLTYHLRAQQALSSFSQSSDTVLPTLEG